VSRAITAQHEASAVRRTVASTRPIARITPVSCWPTMHAPWSPAARGVSAWRSRSGGPREGRPVTSVARRRSRSSRARAASAGGGGVFLIGKAKDADASVEIPPYSDGW